MWSTYEWVDYLSLNKHRKHAMQDESKSTTSKEDQWSLDLTGDDALYLQWAQDIGFNLEVQVPNVDPPVPE